MANIRRKYLTLRAGSALFCALGVYAHAEMATASPIDAMERAEAVPIDPPPTVLADDPLAFLIEEKLPDELRLFGIEGDRFESALIEGEEGEFTETPTALAESGKGRAEP